MEIFKREGPHHAPNTSLNDPHYGTHEKGTLFYSSQIGTIVPVTLPEANKKTKAKKLAKALS